MKIALTGAGGFVGGALRKRYPNHIVINRHDDEKTILEKLQNVDVAINLAGAPIIQRWTEPYKKILIDSRVHMTRQLVHALNKSNVKHFISTSAVGIYPDGAQCDEHCNQMADDFLGELAQKWENEAHKCSKPTAILRFGVVLGKDGGALKTMLFPFKLGVGGIIGNGKMMTSWIDIEDLMRIYDFVIERTLEGTYNATSPSPVTNYVFTKTLGKVLRRPTILPIPEFALRLMYGEGASVLTGSKEVYPTALQEARFSFNYPDLQQSLSHLLDEDVE